MEEKEGLTREVMCFCTLTTLHTGCISSCVGNMEIKLERTENTIIFLHRSTRKMHSVRSTASDNVAYKRVDHPTSYCENERKRMGSI